MFYNQKLSPQLSDLFPLPAIKLQLLPASLQIRLRQLLNLATTANPMLRPSQATTPMGFKWSVDIGHFSARAVIAKSLRILAVHRNSIPLSTTPNFLSKANAPVTLARDRPVICHIIDDISIITIDWDPALICTWHRILRTLFTAAGLPINVKKSCPINEVVVDGVPFIGLAINLKSGLVTPQSEKYNSLASSFQTMNLNGPIAIHDWQHILGKLCWYATLHRPTLSAFAVVYKYPRRTPKHPTARTFTVSSEQQQELLNIVALITACSASLATSPLHISVAVYVTSKSLSLLTTHLETHQCWNLWAISHRQARQEYTGTSLHLEAEAIIPQLPWKRA